MKAEDIANLARSVARFLGYKKDIDIYWNGDINYSFAVAKKDAQRGMIVFGTYLALTDDFFQSYVAAHEACHVVIADRYGKKHGHDKLFKQAERIALKSIGLDVEYAKIYPKKLRFFGKTVFHR